MINRFLPLVWALVAAPLVQAGYFGASAGLGLDDEKEFFSLRYGYTFSQNEEQTQLHSAELDASYLAYAPEGAYPGNPSMVLDANRNLVPAPSSVEYDGQAYSLLLTYRFQYRAAERLWLHAGLGGGLSYVDTDFESELGFNYSDEAFVLAGQALAGVGYEVTQDLQVYGGLRYLVSGDVEANDVDVTSLDTLVVELGVFYQF